MGKGVILKIKYPHCKIQKINDKLLIERKTLLQLT